MELEAVYSFLFLQDGQRREGDPPGIMVASPAALARPARGRSRDTLFVHLALHSREKTTSSLYHGVTEALRDAYFLSAGSVTAALRQAIRAANEFLMRHNLRVEGVDKQQGGISCAVLRDEEIFIAQAGPTLALIAHQGRLERLPPRRPGHITPLGVGYGVDTRFYHSWIHPGDVLLLAGDSLEAVDNQAVGKAIIYEGISAGVNNLAELVNEQAQVRQLLIEFTAAGQELQLAAEVQAAPELAPPSPAPVPSESRPRSQPEPSPQPQPVWQPEEPEAVVEPSRPVIEIDVEGGARRAASGLARLLAGFTGGVGRMLESLFGSEVGSGQAVKQEGPSTATLGFLAVIIPILVTVIAVAVYMQRGRATQFQQLLEQVSQESLAAQQAAGDPASARGHWDSVLALSDQALALRPTSDTVAEIQQQAHDALDILDEVTRLQVDSLHTYTGGDVTSPAALVVEDLATYVLDTGLDRVYKHVMADESTLADGINPETIMYKGQVVAGTGASDLVDLIWFPKSGQIQETTVAVLDMNGQLLRYRPAWGNVVGTQLVLPSSWASPVATAVYADNFYVLDVGAGQIWKYSAREHGFPDPPETYQFADRRNLDLSKMIDMTIDRDGHLYLLANDGQILKFYGGEPKPFELEGLAEPLERPTAIFCGLTGLNPLFYIVDSGSGRIVRTTPQGLFIAQYRARGADLADPFTKLGGIYVEEAPVLHVYATAGDHLVIGSLP